MGTPDKVRRGFRLFSQFDATSSQKGLGDIARSFNNTIRSIPFETVCPQNTVSSRETMERRTV